MDDQEAALRAVAAGEIPALERLYRELRVPVFVVALSAVRDPSVAEDVLHDTFVRVCDKAHMYRPAASPRAWVLAIARNLAIDAVRRRVHEPPFEEVQPAFGDDRLEGFALTSALMTLAPMEREIVALHALGGLTHAEIAAQLNLPPGTVRWKYRVALDRLRPFVSEGRDA